MKSTYMIATTVLTTLTVLVFVGAFAWSVSPASALASSLAAAHSSPDGNHCARLDGKHTELLDAYLRITLELDDSQHQALTPVIDIVEEWRQDTVTACESAQLDNVDASLAAMQAVLGRTEQAIADLRPAFGEFQAQLSEEQKAQIDGMLAHHHERKARRHGWQH